MLWRPHGGGGDARTNLSFLQGTNRDCAFLQRGGTGPDRPRGLDSGGTRSWSALFQRRGRGCSSHIEPVELHPDGFRSSHVLRREGDPWSTKRWFVVGAEGSHCRRSGKQQPVRWGWPWNEGGEGTDRRNGGGSRLASRPIGHGVGEGLPAARRSDRHASQGPPQPRDGGCHSASGEPCSASAHSLQPGEIEDLARRRHDGTPPRNSQHRAQPVDGTGDRSINFSWL